MNILSSIVQKFQMPPNRLLLRPAHYISYANDLVDPYKEIFYNYPGGILLIHNILLISSHQIIIRTITIVALSPRNKKAPSYLLLNAYIMIVFNCLHYSSGNILLSNSSSNKASSTSSRIAFLVSSSIL